MNDELSGQLSNTYSIPAYAWRRLHLCTESEVVPVEGAHGLFDLTTNTSLLRLQWEADGPDLVCLPWQADDLAWDGVIRVGGYINALHLLQVDGVTQMVVYLGGKPLDSSRALYPIGTSPHFHDPLSVGIPESETTWMLPQDSTFARLMQEALTQNLRVHLVGHLASADHTLLPYLHLPLLLENVLVFAP